MAIESEIGLKRLVSTSGIYLVGGVAQQAIGFLLLPLYTKFLATHEYGVLELLNTFGLISLMLLNLGLPSAIMKCYHRDCTSETDKEALLPTAIVLSVPILSVGCFVIFWLSTWLSSLLLGVSEGQHLVKLLATWILLSGVSSMLLAVFRAREEALIYSMLTLSQCLLLLILNIYFVAFLELGVEGILWGNTLSSAGIIFSGIPLLRKRVKLVFQKTLVKPLLAFALVMIPTALAGWVMEMSDRYFLGFFGNLSEVGLYSLGYKFGRLLEIMIVWPFQLAWPAFSFSISTQPNHKQIYARALTYLSAILICAVLMLSLMGRSLLQLIVHHNYIGAYRVVPLIALSYLFNGIYFCVSPGMHLSGNTRYLPLLIVGASVINILLNILMIPHFGMMGAAWATMISFALLASFTFLFSNTVYPIAYEYGRLIKLCSAGLILYCMSLFVHESSAFVLVSFNTMLILAFPLSLILVKFFDVEEYEVLLKSLSSVKKCIGLSALWKGSKHSSMEQPVSGADTRWKPAKKDR